MQDEVSYMCKLTNDDDDLVYLHKSIGMKSLLSGQD